MSRLFLRADCWWDGKDDVHNGCSEQASHFHRGSSFVSAAASTEESGIRLLFPNAGIDDYVFEPCGYSMNGMEGAGFSTIHITPEPGYSYASLEVSGYSSSAIDPTNLVAKVCWRACLSWPQLSAGVCM